MIPCLPFGRTGHESSRVIFGAAALGKVTQEEADLGLAEILAAGVNHVDTAPSYGESELRLGPWMEKHRHEVFLATKTLERTKGKALDELKKSLERLRTDRVDLFQLHCLVEAADWETAMGNGGALEAAIEAKEKGLTRFIGVTGHGPAAAAMHAKSLARFPFDSVLLPCNYAVLRDPAYAADFESLVGICRSRGVAVQTIKAAARRPLGESPRRFHTWYEPLEDPADVSRAVRFVLSRPGLFLNTAGDLRILRLILDAAARPLAAPTDAEMAEMAARLGLASPFAK
ncbi:MAG: aldo/keto reductase [Planctomycetota bacterium]